MKSAKWLGRFALAVVAVLVGILVVGAILSAPSTPPTPVVSTVVQPSGVAPIIVVQPQESHFWRDMWLWNTLTTPSRVEEHHYYQPAPVSPATPRPASGSSWSAPSAPSYSRPFRPNPSRPSSSGFNRPSTSRSFGRRK